MLEDGTILIGKSAKPKCLHLSLANRHGLITGATGTGKTVTLQVLAEGFSNAGVPVFAADIKGDLSGIAAPGQGKEPFVKRAQEIGIPYQPDSFPVVFWDLFGEQGHRIRATVSEMGPLLLSRLLDLNETQEGVLNIAFRVADEQGLLLLDLKDLRALLQLVAENAKELTRAYGNVSKASVGDHPAPAPRPGEPEGRGVPGRAGPRHRRPDADRPGRAGRSSTSSPPTS